MDWGALSEDKDQVAAPETPATPAPAKPDAQAPQPPKPGEQPQPKPGEQPQPPAPKPGEQPQPPAQPAAKPGEQPAPPPQQQPKEQPQQQPAQQPQETPEQKAERERLNAEAAAKVRQKLVDSYKLPEELAARFATEPEAVLPELAATLHQAVLGEMQQWATQFVPAFFQSYQRAQRANEEAQTQFYGKWPQLKGKENQVLQVGSMYRQMNPKATPEEALQKVGELACAALGIPITAAAPGAGTPQQRVVQQQPVRPAGVGGSQAGNTPQSDNIFATMAEDMLHDDG